MRGVGRNLNRVFVPVMMIFGDKGGDFSLLNEALGCAATQIDNSSNPGASGNVHHVEHVLYDVEHEVVLLLKTRRRNTYGDSAIRHRRAENRNPGFVGRSENAVLRSNLRQFATDQL